MRWALVISIVLMGAGCQLIPEIAHQPVVHNPFPQLTKVAVAPFFNLSTEPTVDGRQFAEAYFNELQLVQGFEVVPVGVVERAIDAYQLSLSNPDEVRKLATVLGVDAVAIGAVTDYTPFYPPRLAMQVEWFAANPCFHPIPPGYGLPWGTPEEEFIPAPLVLESEMALARAQLRTQTPPYKSDPVPLPPPQELPQQEGDGDNSDDGATPASAKVRTTHAVEGTAKASNPGGNIKASYAAALLKQASAGDITAMIAPGGPQLPANYPDARAFIPPPPQAAPCSCLPTIEPVLRHTRTYNGNDAELTEALASYAFFKDDGRGGSWQGYLQRSDDFIRFCCHLHIYEMLSARRRRPNPSSVALVDRPIYVPLERLRLTAPVELWALPDGRFNRPVRLQEAPAVSQDINVLALVKGAERYVFLYDDASRAETLRVLGRYASNPQLSFSWYDAAVLSQKIRQESQPVAAAKPRFQMPQLSDTDDAA